MLFFFPYRQLLQPGRYYLPGRFTTPEHMTGLIFRLSLTILSKGRCICMSQVKYPCLKVLLEENRWFFHRAHSSIKEGVQGNWRQESLSRWGAGQVPTKTLQKIFQILRLKQQVLLTWSSCREAAETTTYHTAGGVGRISFTALTALLCLFNGSPCAWNGNQPKMGKGRLRGRMYHYLFLL